METAKEIAADIVRELREKPEHWIQGVAARTADGESVEARHPSATCWCLWGHVVKRIPLGREEHDILDDFVHAIPDLRDGEGLGIFNDREGRTVEDVIAVCEKIANAA